MSEAWRPVVGYEGIYEVSDLGNVRRIVKWSQRRNAPTENRKLKTTHYGYRRVTLSDARSFKKEHPVHRLVYEAFVGSIPAGLQINHKNGMSGDNRPSNLEAVTPSENMLHSYRALGRIHPRGARKLSDDEVRLIRSAYVPYSKGEYSAKALASRFGVCDNTITDVARIRYYAHVL